MKNDLDIGKAGEHLVIADLLISGIKAFITDQNLPYDVVAEGKNKLIRIQVKTTRKFRRIKPNANPIYFFHIKRTGKKGNKKYTKKDFECYALVVIDQRRVFYIPFDKVNGSASICVRDKNIRYAGKRGGSVPSGLYWQDLTWRRFYGN